MTKKYTPGPWELDEEIPPNVYAVCGKDGGQPLVALTSNLPFPFAGVDNIDEEEANARLIACAPELLEALEKVTKELHEMCKDESDDPSVGIFGWDYCNRIVSEANKLITKANGR